MRGKRAKRETKGIICKKMKSIPFFSVSVLWKAPLLLMFYLLAEDVRGDERG